MRPFGQIGDGEIPPEWGWPEVDRGIGRVAPSPAGAAPRVAQAFAPTETPRFADQNLPWDWVGQDAGDFPGWASCYPFLFITHAFFGLDGSTPVRAIVGTPDTANGEFDPGYLSLGSTRPIGDANPSTDRILLAVSSDGVNWTKTGLVIVEYGGVPCLAVEGNTLYLFCVAAVDEEDGSKFARTAFVCARTDDLVTWTYSKPAVTFPPEMWSLASGETFDNEVADPSVVAAFDGSGWYLYFTNLRGFPGVKGETHGSTFLADAASLASMSWDVRRPYAVYPPWNDTSGLNALDPNVLFMTTSLGWYYQYYAAGNGMKDLRLDDGDGETVIADAGTWVGTMTYPGSTLTVEASMTNGAVVGGQYKWYAQLQDPRSEPRPAVILSYTWIGGWVQDGTAPILEVTETYESIYVMDAAVVKFGDCYVMAYVTRIPVPLGVG